MTLLTVGSSPRNATTDANGLRHYTWLGRRLPSVTTLRRMAGVPHGLHQWAITQVINRALEDEPAIHARLASGDTAQLALIRHELRTAATAERDAAADLGTAVHDAAAAGKSLTEVGPDIAPRLRQFLEWRAASRVEILAKEFQVWNLEVGYAGTCDLLARFPDGSIWVIDLKTGRGLYGEHALQLIAYLMAEFSGFDDVVDRRTTALLRQATGIAVLHLAADHWEFRSLEADAATWAAFRGLCAFATWMADHGEIDTVTRATRRAST